MWCQEAEPWIYHGAVASGVVQCLVLSRSARVSFNQALHWKSPSIKLCNAHSLCLAVVRLSQHSAQERGLSTVRDVLCGAVQWDRAELGQWHPTAAIWARCCREAAWSHVSHGTAVPGCVCPAACGLGTVCTLTASPRLQSRATLLLDAP